MLRQQGLDWVTLGHLFLEGQESCRSPLPYPMEGLNCWAHTEKRPGGCQGFVSMGDAIPAGPLAGCPTSRRTRSTSGVTSHKECLTGAKYAEEHMSSQCLAHSRYSESSSRMNE